MHLQKMAVWSSFKWDFEALNCMIKFLINISNIWVQKLNKIILGTLKKIVFVRFVSRFFYIFLNCSHIYPPVCTCRKWKLEEMVSAFRRFLQTLRLLTIAASRDQKPRPSRGQKKQFLPWNPTPCKPGIFQEAPETPPKILHSKFSIPIPNSKHHQKGWDSFCCFWLGLNSLHCKYLRRNYDQIAAYGRTTTAIHWF
jgi:hypothetical protein